MVVAWSNHCCTEPPCSWVPHRTHAAIDTSTPFTWSSSSHMSTFSSTNSSTSCSGPSLRLSPPSSPVTLYLPPHLSTYPPFNLPSALRNSGHLFTLAPYSEANRISEEVDSSVKSESDDHSRVSQTPLPTTTYQRLNYTPGSTGPKVIAATPHFYSSNIPPRGSGLSPSHKKVTYKGGSFTPEAAPTSPSRGTVPATTTESAELGAYWQLLDDDLKPTMPQPSCQHSQQIFEEHKELAHQLLVVQEEIVYLDKEKSRMLKKLEEQDKEQLACRHRYSDKINQLKSKNESLRQDHARLSHQLEEIRSRRQSRQQERSTASNQHYHQSSSSTPISSHFSPHHLQSQTIHQYHEQQQQQQQQQQYPTQRQHPAHQYYYENPLHPLYPHHMHDH